MKRTKRFQMSSCERRGAAAAGELAAWGLYGRGVPGRHPRGREGGLLGSCLRRARAWHRGGGDGVGMVSAAGTSWRAAGMQRVKWKRSDPAAARTGGSLLRGAGSTEVHGRGERSFAPCPPGPRTWCTLPGRQLGLSSKMGGRGGIKLLQHFGCQNGAGWWYLRSVLMAPCGCGCSPETRQPRVPRVPSVAAVGSVEGALGARRVLSQQRPVGAAPQPRFSWPAGTAVLPPACGRAGCAM